MPDKVAGFSVKRDENDRRNVSLKWDKVAGAYAYEVSFGVNPDKLYSSLLIYDTKYDLHSLNIDSDYYFNIKAVGESGVGEATAVTPTK